MLRFLAGAAACFLLLTGAFLIWQSRAENRSSLPPAPQPRTYSASMVTGAAPLVAPEATPKTREEKRFGRYDKNKDGKVEADEYFAARRKNFDKLDLDHDGKLSFQEYAAKAVEKFDAAGGRKGWLSPAEFAATAPPPPKHRTAKCARAAPAEARDDNSSNEEGQ